MAKKRALITGITGQTGSYLAHFLLGKGYEVHGIKRRSSLFNTDRIDDIYEGPNTQAVNLSLHYGDLADSGCLVRLIEQIQPDEIYNLAAQSHVAASFEIPEYTADVGGLGTLRLLDAIRLLGMTDTVRFYQASTSELFGKVQETPQTETTPFYPRSPYAVAKLFSYWTVVNYREAYNMYACNGILFNHESPLRGETFVTRKITRALTRIKEGLQTKVSLGNLDAKRDWGHAGDYVEMQWLMLQQDKPDDYVIASGEQHSVREFVERAGRLLDMDIQWQGEGVDEVGIDATTGDVVVDIHPAYYRPTEVESLLGNPEKARRELGWECKRTFDDLIKEMVENDIQLAKQEVLLAETSMPVCRPMLVRDNGNH